MGRQDHFEWPVPSVTSAAWQIFQRRIREFAHNLPISHANGCPHLADFMALASYSGRVIGHALGCCGQAALIQGMCIERGWLDFASMVRASNPSHAPLLNELGRGFGSHTLWSGGSWTPIVPCKCHQNGAKPTFTEKTCSWCAQQMLHQLRYTHFIGLGNRPGTASVSKTVSILKAGHRPRVLNCKFCSCNPKQHSCLRRW